MGASLEAQFDQAMMDIYVRAKKEVKYNASRFFAMLDEYGGVKTARILVQSEQVSEGYVALWDRKRLDLTVEALIIQPKWKSLFSDEEVNKAYERLKSYHYNFPQE